MNILKKVMQAMTALAVAAFVLAATTVPTLAKDANHAVTFMYGTKAYVAVVPDGGVAVPPADTAIDGYSFVGWVGNIFNVTEDRIILGAYTKVQPVATSNSTTVQHIVSFRDGVTGCELSRQTVNNGANATVPGVPCHPGYRFIGWDGSANDITSSRVITAVYERIGAYHNCWYVCKIHYPWYCGVNAANIYNAYEAKLQAEQAAVFAAKEAYEERVNNETAAAVAAYEAQMKAEQEAAFAAKEAYEAQMRALQEAYMK